ncbi:MAG: type II toxin-antitoxin system VapC family toxin [Nitrospiraceae bacterium]|nr:MAG: type II toxin-antitoxin system VapC family toxin [Nitrospiraceae bacterium]
MEGKCYLLDTNVLGYLVELKSGSHTPEGKALEKRLEEIKGKNIFICCITIGEIEYGLKIAPDKDSTKQGLAKRLIEEFYSYPVDNDIARDQYATLRAKLFQRYAPRDKRHRNSDKKRVEEWIDPTTSKELQVQENDIWIAAVAMAYNFVLVTHDKMNAIKSVVGEDLTIVDWAK